LPDYQQAKGIFHAKLLLRVVNEDLFHLLPRIQAPILLVWGENDQDTPLADELQMERLMLDAGLVTFKGAGHHA
jgi:pimeloyl-ACP methyl ester carboxylesterase